MNGKFVFFKVTGRKAPTGSLYLDEKPKFPGTFIE